MRDALYESGTDHVNEQPDSYWIEKMDTRGYAYDEERSLARREAWAEKDVSNCYV